MKEIIDTRELSRMILYLEGRKYEHHQECEECREYGFEQGCEQGKALQETRVKWAKISLSETIDRG